MIEYFVHVDADDPPDNLVLAVAEIPDSVSHLSISPKQLPANWRRTPPPPELAELGDAFARHLRPAVLIVPSALAPAESNWLINPRHRDFSKIRVSLPEKFRYD